MMAVSFSAAGSASRPDAVVVGAGLIGAAAVLGLTEAGLRVCWVAAPGADAGPAAAPGAAPGWDSRVYAVSPGSIEWLSSVGAWRGVDGTRTCDVTAMRVSGDDGRSGIGFDSHDARMPRLAVICESSNLACALERAVAARGDTVTRIAGPVVDLRVGERTASVGLSGGTTLRTPLVVAADGAGSTVRELAGIAVDRRDYGQTAVVANFRCAVPHHGVARQWFFGDAVLALLPLPGDLRSMVWSCADAHAAWLLGLPLEALAGEVARVAGGEAGSLQALAPACGFPLRLQRVSQLVGPRVALVGDAAHTVHPLAGQGMNLGFGDCRELSAVLSARGPQSDPGDLGLLRRYQRGRAEPIATMRFATDGLFRLFSSTLPGVARLRNFGMGWVDRTPLLKRELMAAAMD
ncbi:MAG: FAD-dependent monooxygenase [Rhodocyclaceae bacterium]|nr:FAD-dependent monooxygenase [Rhodocyclaceae bacterium]